MLKDPQWTRVQDHLGHKSIIDYIITDRALIKESSNIFVDSTDIGWSDHYLLGLNQEGFFVRVGKKQGAFCKNGE